MDKKVSIVIVNWNTKKLIHKCVMTLRKYTKPDYELILVDNGSKDGSVETIKELSDERTTTIFLDKNLGFSGGNNRGIKEANGNLICLLNTDAFVTNGWLESMIYTMETKGAGMVGPWTNHAKGKQRHKPKYLLIPKFFRPIKEVDFLSFFCVMIKREVFSKIGLLDENFKFGTIEDVDFCRRAKLAGYKLIVDGKSWVWHDAHGTMAANQLNEQNLLKENRKIYERKWGTE